MWDDTLTSEIEDMFAAKAGCYAFSELGASNEAGGYAGACLDEGTRLIDLRRAEAEDPAWRAWCQRLREQRRKARMAADPEYAARRKAQMKASYERRKKRLKAAKKRAR